MGICTARLLGAGCLRPAGRRVPSPAATVGLLCLAFAFGVAGCGETRAGSTSGSSAPGVRAQAARATPVEFRAADGLVLRGYRYGAGERWVILVHDQGQDLRVWKELVGELSRHGFRVLAFDLRGHGGSDGARSAGQAPADVLAALSFAESQGARSRYLIGAGGGATAALVAAGTREVSALVALSPLAELDGVPRDAIREARAPKLFIVGWLDHVAAEQSDEVFRRSIGWTVRVTFPVETQGTDLLVSPWSRHVNEKILAFLRAYS